MNPKRNVSAVNKHKNTYNDIQNMQPQVFGQRSSSLSKLGQQNYEQMIQDQAASENDNIQQQYIHYEKENDHYPEQNEVQEQYVNHNENGQAKMSEVSERYHIVGFI